METWEYMTVALRMKRQQDLAESLTLLNQMGDQGWECVGIAPGQVSAMETNDRKEFVIRWWAETYVALLKRRKQ